MSASGPALVRMRAIGTTAEVAVVDPGAAPRAALILRDELAAIDLACSRFRPDSEIAAVERAGDAVRVSPLLFAALEAACRVAERTGGAVDPTVGSAMDAIGYDRDFEDVAGAGSGPGRGTAGAGAVPGWRAIELDARHRTVRVRPGVHVDLGATAKALVVDRAATRIAGALGVGTLVSVGGDVAVQGPAPEGGWAVGIAPDASAGPGHAQQVVAVDEGAIASSSTTVRAWSVAGRPRHHIVDPATGDCAATCWTLVSAFAPSCVEANAATTAAIVWGAAAPGRLEGLGVPARLVDERGGVLVLNGWPADPTVRTAPRCARSRARAAAS
ncbi:MAG TPA: FAD:protein FMN transferase [Acidimicrobiales bacterium]|nr:FAD:protein FMN transferase [Acidimicrobiales bacterium]